MSITWILVADTAKARLFATAEDDQSILELKDLLNPEGRGREPAQDRPPRTHESFDRSRHAIEAHTSLEEKAVEVFARELDAVLEHGRIDHSYEDLVLIAPPQFLGALNASMNEHVRDRVVAELSKDLADADWETIRTHLPAHLQQFHPAGTVRVWAPRP